MKKKKIEEADWYETWFDTEYYHLLYQHRDYKEAEVFLDNLISYLSLPLGSKVLDLACGKGRHSIFLHEKGYDVTGLDLSEQSIAALKEKEEEGLSFHQWDMRELYKKDNFDAVFNLFTSFGYFDDVRDNLLVLNSIRDSLTDDGRAVIDFLNVHQVRNGLPDHAEIKRGEILFSTKKEERDGKVVKTIVVTDKAKQFNFEESVQLFSLDDFKQMFKETGLQLIEHWGDYDLNTYSDDSPRLIMLLEKA